MTQETCLNNWHDSIIFFLFRQTCRSIFVEEVTNISDDSVGMNYKTNMISYIIYLYKARFLSWA